MRSRQDTLDFLLEDRVKFCTVSGIGTTKPALIRWFDENIPEIELITTKSFSVEPKLGNREPIVVEVGVGDFGNAVGLKNPGMDKAYYGLFGLLEKYGLRSFLNVSLAANCIDDFVVLIKKFDRIADCWELNFSCPHAEKGFGSSIGSEAKLVESYVKEIRKHTVSPLIVKLSPNVDDIGVIARAAVLSGADGIAAINTAGPELYLEHNSGSPILYNPNGHKGGKSGGWINDIALRKVEEVKKAVGNSYPVIGMGGVSCGEDVRRMRDAGADVVGVGSVLARVRVDERPYFFANLKSDAEKRSNNARLFVSDDRLAEYKSFNIRKISQRDDLRTFELDGKLDYKAGQFAFLFVPNVGEKPFSIAKSDPLTFFIKRREFDPDKEKGLVTNGLFKLREYDRFILRGPYGNDAPGSDKRSVYIVAGGTGIAVVPKLVERLDAEEKHSISVYHGFSGDCSADFINDISNHARYIPVPDDDVAGRVLDVLKRDLILDADSSCFYNIGPAVFMKNAMDLEVGCGGDPKDIYSSLETNCMCGVRLCGECECGGALACDKGTFFSLDYLRKNDIDILELLK